MSARPEVLVPGFYVVVGAPTSNVTHLRFARTRDVALAMAVHVRSLGQSPAVVDTDGAAVPLPEMTA